MKKLLLILSLITFSFSAETTCTETCPAGTEWTLTGTTPYTGYYRTDGYSEPDAWVCSSTIQKFYHYVHTPNPPPSTWIWHEKTRYDYTCQADTYCTDQNKTYDPVTRSCEVPPLPSCDIPGQSWNELKEKCECDNGYPPIYGDNGWECQVPKCEPYDGTLPLFGTNMTQSNCDSLANAVLGFSSSYYDRGGTTCCYSDSVKSSDDDCGINWVRDEYGVCQPIRDDYTEPTDSNSTPPLQVNPDGTVTNPDGTISNPDGTVSAPDGASIDTTTGTITTDNNQTINASDNTDNTDNCQEGYAYNYLTGGCSLYVPYREPTTGNGSLLDPDGNLTLPDGNGSDGFLLEFQNDFEGDMGAIEDLLNIDSAKYSSKALEGLGSMESTFLSIHSVTVPSFSSGGCACSDHTSTASTGNSSTSFSKTWELCQYFQMLIDGIRVLLWIIVIYLLITKIREIV